MSKADRTREFIIEKTAPIFNVKGYAGTSISDLTEATGLTKGSIYGNFENKDEVALAAFDCNYKKISSYLKAEMDKHSSYKEKLLVHASFYENFFKAPFPDGGCPILNTAIEADDTHPQLRERASEAISSWKNKIMELIKKGIDNKEFRPDVPLEQTAISLIALIEGGIMVAKLTGKLNYRKLIMQSVEKAINDLT
ncbi:TetR/AcrR family transcriptional regulator [Pinibacter aurantiacus]|uniref:TetR/AcrR family transcriptional regulator n=1 Tax=Pinibacter aurantiacus TaxID=2851599 RepID=A0A9E2SGF3_9BACT|nr:TetR/AcrR family transcriptional regulator [Pinibacter aurantiacus]MBV4360145.1 TetR/AcrR family transcriptional regulator [Pinibacter aurantiacus]